MIRRFIATLLTTLLLVSFPTQAEPQASPLVVTSIEVRPEYSIVRDYVSLFFIAIPMTEQELKAQKEAGSDADENLAATGSLVVISPHYALTAAHMFTTPYKDVRYGSIRGKDEKGEDRDITVKLVKKDDKTDLALVTADFGCPCVSVATRTPTVDQTAYAVGFPLYAQYELQMLSIGLVQGFTNGFLVTTTTMAPGASGGGTFVKQDNKYVLVGIISAIGQVQIGPMVLKIQQLMYWITFSASAETIQGFLKDVTLN